MYGSKGLVAVLARSSLACALVLSVWAAAAPGLTAAPGVEQYRYSARWPRPTWHLSKPAGVAMSTSGIVYVADRDNNRIEVYARSGERLGRWGESGTSIGRFRAPTGVTVDPSGSVYVTDRDNHRVQKFTAAGVPVLQWGGSGTAVGQLSMPTGIAVDTVGNVYVADTGNNRIQKFDANGNHLASWGTPGSGAGQFLSPKGVAVDSLGNVYVADTNNQRIQKLNSSGVFQSAWGIRGTLNGQFKDPEGVSVDSAANVYVADTNNHRVQKFSYNPGSGAHIYETQWGSKYNTSSSEDWEFDDPSGIAAVSTPDGIHVYVADTDNDRIQVFSTAGAGLMIGGSWGKSDARFKYAADVAAGSGGVYVVDRDNSRVQRFTNEGLFVGKWGTYGTTQNNQFNKALGVACDSAGNVYVADTGNHRVQKFAANGFFWTKWGSSGSQNGWFSSPKAIACAGADYVYVADSGNNRIQRFSALGEYQTKWGTLGSGEGGFSNPSGVAVDPSGNVYVADTGNHRIQKFTRDGGFLLAWGALGTGTGQFSSPNDVACDADGNVFVADTGNHRVQKFGPSGTPLASWGIQGSEEGEFWSPTGIAVDSAGYVYVADRDNHRVQRFVPPMSVAISGVEEGRAYRTSVTWGVSFVGTGITARTITFNGIPVPWEPPETRRTVSVDGAYSLSAVARDAGGEASRTVRFTIDRTPPKTVASAAATYDDVAKVHLGATDALSGVDRTYYRLGDGPLTEGAIATVTRASGSHRLEFWSVDKAGNEESRTAITFAVRDTLPPVTTSDAKSSYESTATVRLSATDAGSDVAATYYTLNGGAITTGTVISAGDPGSHEVKFWSVDSLGHIEETRTAAFHVTVGSRIALSASPVRLTYGGSLRLVATLTRQNDGRALPEQRVIFEHWHRGRWTHLGSTDSATGVHVAYTKPWANNIYRARFGGSDDVLPSASSVQRVQVRAKLTAPYAPSVAYRNRAFTTYGWMTPRHWSGRILIRCERYENGRYVLRRTYWAPLYRVYSYNRYVGSVSLPYAGQWRLRAYHADATHIASYSPPRYLTVR